MERGRKRRCLRDKEKGQEMNSCSADYFGVGRDATSSKVDMRVDYRNKNIGKFFHRIYEEPTLVVAVFLVEIISHYGGRKPQKGGRKYKEMNLRALAHEIFNRLPDIPKHLDECLNKYIPDKEYRKVPDVYKLFIIETWNKHKEEVLRLVDTCVLQGTLHLQVLTEDALTIPSITSHGEPEPLISKMEIEEEQTPDQLETKHDKDRLLEKHTIEMADLKTSYEKEILKLNNIIADLQAQLSSQKTNCSTTINDNQEIMLEIDECLRHVSPITREEANKIPTELQCCKVTVDVERAKCSYSDICLEVVMNIMKAHVVVDFGEAVNDELVGDILEDLSDLLPEHLESDFRCCGEAENKSGAGVLSIQKQIGAIINHNTTSDDQEEQYSNYDIPMISMSDLQEILKHPKGYADPKAGTSRNVREHQGTSRNVDTGTSRRSSEHVFESNLLEPNNNQHSLPGNGC